MSKGAAVAGTVPGSENVRVERSGIEGLGLFAARDLRAGEKIVRFDSVRVVDGAHPLRPEAGEWEFHCDRLPDGTVVLMAPPGRHCNSSCDPSAFVRWEEEHYWAVARRDIARGAEVTVDYAIGSFGEEEQACRCGAARCRGVIPSSFFDLPELFLREYERLLAASFIAAHRREYEAMCARLSIRPR
jgi:hypothetical protein